MIEFDNITEQELVKVELPFRTKTYIPVSHRSIIEAVGEQLDKKGLTVTNKRYRTDSKGNKVIATYDIRQEGYDEMGMRLAFRNSYDKSMSVALVAGSNVWICSNGCISGEMQYMRKHTGSVVQGLNNSIIDSINQLEHSFIMHNKHKDAMKEIELDKKLISRLAGEMFINEEIITITQLGILKKEYEEPTYEEFSDNSLWSLYNNVTHSLKTSHTTEYVDRHVNLHNFITKEFSI